MVFLKNIIFLVLATLVFSSNAISQTNLEKINQALRSVNEDLKELRVPSSDISIPHGKFSFICPLKGRFIKTSGFGAERINYNGLGYSDRYIRYILNPICSRMKAYEQENIFPQSKGRGSFSCH